MTGLVRLSACSLALALLAHAPASSGESAELRAALEAVDASMQEALRAGNAAAMASHYTADAEINGVGQATVRGREAVEQQIEYVIRHGVADYRQRLEEIVDGGETAATLGHVEFLGQQGQLLRRLRYMTLWKREAGAWKIHRDFALPLPGGQAWTSSSARPEDLDVRVQKLPSTQAVVLPMTGSHDGHGEAIARLGAYISAKGLDPTGPLFGRYYNDPRAVPTEELRWEVGLPVEQATGVAAPFEIRAFDEPLVALLVVPGPHDAERPWDAFSQWIDRNGYEQTGPSMEIWLDGPRVEMRAPVAKR